jgi:hypothetical protein
MLWPRAVANLTAMANTGTRNDLCPQDVSKHAERP